MVRNMLKVKQLGAVAAMFAMLFAGQSAAAEAGRHQPIVEELKQIVQVDPSLKEGLEASIRTANRLDAPTLEAYYNYLDSMVTLIPTERNILPKILEFYYLIDNSPNHMLQKNELFQQWTVKFADDWGRFLDTPASAAQLETFYTNANYSIDDYMVDPSGWLTYNQFFARHVKPGKRPVDALSDDSVIVSPADSVFQGHWTINDDSKITVKGLTWSVNELLDGSPYKARFKGGTFMHAFLNVNDYHRYHVPVRGTVLESRQIPGKVVLDVIKKSDGSLDVVDGTGYQFSQARGLIVLDSPVGLVAVLPIGMAQVSSVNLSAEEGVGLSKGEEFGYFTFGGSDIIVMFEAKAKVNFTAEVGTHYKQGTAIGKIE